MSRNKEKKNLWNGKGSYAIEILHEKTTFLGGENYVKRGESKEDFWGKASTESPAHEKFTSLTGDHAENKRSG